MARVKRSCVSAAVAVAAAVAIDCSSLPTQHVAAASRPDAAYQDALRTYSTALPIGTTRKVAEDQLHSTGKDFKRFCCMNTPSPNAYDDLTEIGEEPHPWYCSRHKVYIGFAFDDPLANGTRYPAA